MPKSEEDKEGIYILQFCHSSAEGTNVRLGDWEKHKATANKCNAAIATYRYKVAS